MRIEVSLPATSANIGPGFDVWGIALNIRNKFYCDISGNIKEGTPKFVVTVSNLFRSTSLEDPLKTVANISKDKENILIKAYLRVFQHSGKKPLAVKIYCHLDIPLERGLGSSATAILAGMAIANELLKKTYEIHYSKEKIFELASKLEGHSDNIAPAMWGGLVVCLKNEKTAEIKAVRIPFLAPVKFAGIIPHFSLNTLKARNVIPKNIEISTVAFQGSRLATLGYLFSKKKWNAEDRSILSIALQDKLHQNQRAPMIKGMKETFEYWYSMGAYGVYLSGSGTTLMGIWPKQKNIKYLNLIQRMTELKVSATEIQFKIDKKGMLVKIN